MKKDFTLLAWVIDESTSMSSRQMDVINGYNNFIKEQKELPGTCAVSLIKFNTVSVPVYNMVDINFVKPLDTVTYRPDGWTALIDAVCDFIDTTGKALSEMAEQDRPERIICLVQTDGEENSSRRFKVQQLKEKIQRPLSQKVFKAVGRRENIRIKFSARKRISAIQKERRR